MSRLLLLMLAIANAACSPQNVRCDGRLRPINVPGPTPVHADNTGGDKPADGHP